MIVVGLQAAVNELPTLERNARRRVRYRVEKYANLIVREARRRVPVRSGALQSTIRTESLYGELTFFIIAGNESVNYAHFVEYGTAYQRPQPYLTPAFELYRAAYVQEFNEALFREMLRAS